MKTIRWFNLLFFIYLSANPLYIYGTESFSVPCREGNFALPLSQQPGPLIGFGENVLDSHSTQVFLFGDSYLGKKTHYVDLIPEILYGLTKDLSIFFNIPIAASFRIDKQHSAGIEDLFLQLEYSIYSRISSCSSDQVTLVANASLPTGSSHKIPPTGFGSIGTFIGATYNRTWIKWFCFTAYGMEIPSSHHRTKFGNAYLYQFGLGRNLTNARGWLFAWMLEIDGTYISHDRIHGIKNPNSGGNVIYFTPSLWASSQQWIVQLGIGWPIQQHLFGHQSSEKILFAFNAGKTF